MAQHDLRNDYGKIPVPTDALQDRIRQGITQGVAERKQQRPRRKQYVAIAGLAASLFVTTFIVPPFASAMSHVPLIGGLYRSFTEQGTVGTEIEKKQLATAIDQTVTDQGITIKVVDAYYDGTTIGMNLTATGVPDVNETKRAAFYEVFKGDKRFEGTENQELAHFKQDGKVWKARIEYDVGLQKLSDSMQVPLVISEMFGLDGNWQFEVPVKRLQAIEQTFNTTVKNPDYTVDVTLKQMTKGQASTTFDYTAVYPKSDQYWLELALFDDKGKEIIKNWSVGTSLVSSSVSGSQRTDVSRIRFGNYVIPSGSYTLHPSLRLSPKTHWLSLKKTSFPYTQQDAHHPLKMTIQQVETSGSHVQVDFLTNSDQKNSDIKLDVKNSMFLIQGNEPPDGREIKPTVEVIDAKQKLLRATFTLSASQIDAIDDFYLQTGYSNTVTNTPIDLKPIPFTVD